MEPCLVLIYSHKPETAVFTTRRGPNGVRARLTDKKGEMIETEGRANRDRGPSQVYTTISRALD
ncbi:hypothetical protein EYF80_044082 [Liparis tanakae]|uniref:Uncharacterized protein n=1 Tax=Liparis tanakae TaxID=230148 RepID=A0A4Z2FXL7_9TELE|nr:hypothetical protein EYF80_044082 [Liparis tanakae]